MKKNGEGRLERALQYYGDQLALVRRLGDERAAAIALACVGKVYELAGEHAPAIECFMAALEMGVELGDRTVIAEGLAGLAASAAADGRDARAERLFKVAIAFLTVAGMNERLARTLIGQARLLKAQARYEEAWQNNAEAQDLAFRVGDRDLLFASQVMNVGLLVALGEVGVSNAKAQLVRHLERSDDTVQRAALHDAVFALDAEAEAHRTLAIEAYTHLYQRSGAFTYRLRLLRLGGTVPSPRAALAPAPEIVQTFRRSLEELISAVEALRVRLSVQDDEGQRAEDLGFIRLA